MFLYRTPSSQVHMFELYFARTLVAAWLPKRKAQWEWEWGRKKRFSLPWRNWIEYFLIIRRKKEQMFDSWIFHYPISNFMSTTWHWMHRRSAVKRCSFFLRMFLMNERTTAGNERLRERSIRTRTSPSVGSFIFYRDYQITWLSWVRQKESTQPICWSQFTERYFIHLGPQCDFVYRYCTRWWVVERPLATV